MSMSMKLSVDVHLAPRRLAAIVTGVIIAASLALSVIQHIWP
jgi:energy-converting hydrogenase Eha subunit A